MMFERLAMCLAVLARCASVDSTFFRLEVPTMAVDVGTEEALASLNLLPFSIVGAVDKFYPKVSFKNHPDWPKAQKAVPCVSGLMTASRGLMIHHVSLRASVQAWSATHELTISAQDVDKITYSLRAICHQIKTLKTNERPVPFKWRPRFQTLYDKIVPGERKRSDEVRGGPTPAILDAEFDDDAPAEDAHDGLSEASCDESFCSKLDDIRDSLNPTPLEGVGFRESRVVSNFECKCDHCNLQVEIVEPPCREPPPLVSVMSSPEPYDHDELFSSEIPELQRLLHGGQRRRLTSKTVDTSPGAHIRALEAQTQPASSCTPLCPSAWAKLNASIKESHKAKKNTKGKNSKKPPMKTMK
eukprot:2753124-Pyramimonas_sp.AAC.1